MDATPLILGSRKNADLARSALPCSPVQGVRENGRRRRSQAWLGSRRRNGRVGLRPH